MKPIMIAILVTLLCVGSSLVSACTTCTGINNVSYCKAGNIAELCRTTSSGCQFSGDRNCSTKETPQMADARSEEPAQGPRNRPDRPSFQLAKALVSNAGVRLTASNQSATTSVDATSRAHAESSPDQHVCPGH